MRSAFILAAELVNRASAAGQSPATKSPWRRDDIYSWRCVRGFASMRLFGEKPIMIFTHLGRIVAVLGTLFGSFLVWRGVSASNVAYSSPLTQEQMKAILRHANSIFESGLALLLGSIVLGVLVEISFSLRRGSDA